MSNAVTDIDQLSEMAIKSKEALGVDKLKVVADAGYCNAIEIEPAKMRTLKPMFQKLTPLSAPNKDYLGKNSSPSTPKIIVTSALREKTYPTDLRGPKNVETR